MSDKTSDKKALTKNNKTKQNIATRIKELDQLVEWFYSPDFTLEEAVPHYKKARQLAASIEKDLLSLKNEIAILADK
ncbi:hypothetical protein FWH13_02545 [Candidatus Saccharibacteria bacterium]|nr:hypothetical protein [Candidatus Saccharibacteria bacterium]